MEYPDAVLILAGSPTAILASGATTEIPQFIDVSIPEIKLDGRFTPTEAFDHI